MRHRNRIWEKVSFVTCARKRKGRQFFSCPFGFISFLNGEEDEFGPKLDSLSLEEDCIRENARREDERRGLSFLARGAKKILVVREENACPSSFLRGERNRYFKTFLPPPPHLGHRAPATSGLRGVAGGPPFLSKNAFSVFSILFLFASLEDLSLIGSGRLKGSSFATREGGNVSFE